MVYTVAMGKGQTVVHALALKYPGASAAGMSISGDDWCRWIQKATFYNAMGSIGRRIAEVKEPHSSGGSSDSDWNDGGGSDGGFPDSDDGSNSGSSGNFVDQRTKYLKLTAKTGKRI